ncbi:MAG: CPBP family intramembrane metalloprotease [Planctomycetes bacterium]|nr:CPBP family intramembrane metalloprotease [Planctomycetota bacterium]
MTAGPEPRQAKDPDGVLRAEWTVVHHAGNEVAHGRYTSYYRNGSRMAEGHFEYGRRVGTWMRWFPDGRVAAKGAPADDEVMAPPEVPPPPTEQSSQEPAASQATPAFVLPLPCGNPAANRSALVMLAVLLVAWLQPMSTAAVSLAATMPDWAMGEGDVQRSELATIYNELPMAASNLASFVALVALWVLSGVRFAEIGMPRLRPLHALAWAVPLFSAWVGLAHVEAEVFPDFVNPHVYYLPERLPGYALLTTSLLLNSLLEESVWRGYVLFRLRGRLGAAPAILISSALFGSYHIYQGIWAGIGIAAFGLLISLAALRLRSIWPGVAAHTAYNLMLLHTWPEWLWPGP